MPWLDICSAYICHCKAGSPDLDTMAAVSANWCPTYLQLPHYVCQQMREAVVQKVEALGLHGLLHAAESSCMVKRFSSCRQPQTSIEASTSHFEPASQHQAVTCTPAGADAVSNNAFACRCSESSSTRATWSLPSTSCTTGTPLPCCCRGG